MSENNPHQKAPLARVEAAKRDLVEQHGDKDQVERYYAGMLPESEMLALARRVMFAPLAGFRRYQNVKASRNDQSSVEATYLYADDVRHDDGCSAQGHLVKFFTRDPADGITGDEWRDYKAIHDAIKPIAQVEIVEHVGICGRCEYRETVRRSVSVRILWAGYELVREYALGGA